MASTDIHTLLQQELNPNDPSLGVNAAQANTAIQTGTNPFDPNQPPPPSTVAPPNSPNSVDVRAAPPRVPVRPMPEPAPAMPHDPTKFGPPAQPAKSDVAVVGPNAAGGPQDPLSAWLAAFGGPAGAGAAFRSSGDQGPVPMEKTSTAPVVQGLQNRVDAAQQNADADLAANQEMKGVTANAAQEYGNNYAQGKAKMQDALDRSGSYMDRAAQALDEYKNTKIDPQHFWANQTTPQKILNIVGLFLGGLGGGENKALTLLQKEIAQDTEAQVNNRDALKTTADGYNSLSGVADKYFHSAAERMSFLNAAKTQEVTAQMAAIASKYADPKIKASMMDAIGKLQKDSVEQIRKIHDSNNQATLQGAEARNQNAQAARTYQEVGMGPINKFMEWQKFQQQGQDGIVYDGGKPVAMRDPKVATEVNNRLRVNATQMAAANQLQGLIDHTGPLSPSDNQAYEAALNELVGKLPPEEAKLLAPVMPGANALGSSQHAAIEQLIRTLKQDHDAEITQLGVNRTPEALGGKRI